MQTAILMIGTNKYVMQDMFNRRFNKIVWASNDLETVAHYYGGVVLEITVKLVDRYKRAYIRDGTTLHKYKNGYGWGCADMKYPPNATWYSFSREYLQKYLISVREIHPDLSPWDDYD